MQHNNIKSKGEASAPEKTDTIGEGSPKKPTKGVSTPRMVQETAAEEPRFLIIKKLDGTDFSKISPFLIHKTMYGLVGELKMLKKIRDGLLVETVSSAQSRRLLKVERFTDIPVEVTPHETLNFTKELSIAETF